MIHQALELKRDCGEGYRLADSDPQAGSGTRCLFERLWLDIDNATTRVKRADLAEPFATLLAEDFVAALRAAAERRYGSAGGRIR